MSQDPRAFAQFRRLLIGVVVEVLQGEAVDAELGGLTCAFEADSGLRFLWFDNWMRFHGSVRVPLRAPLDEARRTRLEARFRAVWPEIVAALGALPLADRLEITRQEVEVVATDHLVIRFDLEAD